MPIFAATVIIAVLIINKKPVTKHLCVLYSSTDSSEKNTTGSGIHFIRERLSKLWYSCFRYKLIFLEIIIFHNYTDSTL